MNRSLFLLTELALLAAMPASAILVIDPLNDNSRDASLWNPPENAGSGNLVEQNGQLEFIQPSGFGVHDSKQRWVRQFPGQEFSWTVTAEVINTTDLLGGEQVNSLGIWVQSAQDPGDEVFLELYSSWTNAKGFNTGMFVNGTSEGGARDSADLGATAGTLRLSFNAATKAITAEYDPTGSSDGEQWVILSQFGIGGSGGFPGGNVDWQMGPNDFFQVGVFGYAEQMSISASQLAFTSFAVNDQAGTGAIELLAVDDRANVGVGTEGYTIHVLDNDIPGDGNSLADLRVSGLSSTRFSGTAWTDGRTITYSVPYPDFEAEDSFTYTITDGTAESSATVRVNVFTPQNPKDDEAIGLIQAIKDLLANSPGGERYLQLYREHIGEVLLLAAINPNVRQKALNVAGHFIKPAPGDGSIQPAADTEALADVYDGFAQGFASLLVNEGDEFVVTQVMLDDANSLRIALEDSGSEGLRADLQEVATELNNGQDFFGITFAQMATLSGVDTQAGARAAIFNPVFDGANFEAYTYTVPGLTPALYKATSLDGSFSNVNAVVNRQGEQTLLLENNAGTGPFFYYIRNSLDD